MTDTLIETCFEQGRPFAMVVPPGRSWADARWYAPVADSPSPKTSRDFERSREVSRVFDAFAIRPFCLHPDTPIVWMHQTTPEAIYNNLCVGTHQTTPVDIYSHPVVGTYHGAYDIVTPTTDDAYRAQARSIIDSLRADGGKTVLSRVVTATSKRQLSAVVREYFELFPDTLRYVYICDDSGLWFGASPEVLLDYDAESQRLRTMSLAGTRKVIADETVPEASASGDQPWDAKNLAEHQYVTDYIMDCLHQHGLDPEITDSTPLRFGEIEHLCDRIEATGTVDPVALADTLSPTPALCGYPKERAYRQIIDTELHPRLYYGGWVGIREGSRFLAHVNLRCARVIPTQIVFPTQSHGARRIRAEGEPLLYALYVGGGLTADSDVEAELAETQAKAKTLMNCIKKHGEY